MTNIIVKIYTVLYMAVGVIICQSERSLERLVICQTPSIGGTSNQLRWEKECGGNSTSFWVSFAKPFLLKIGHSKPSKIVEFSTYLYLLI